MFNPEINDHRFNPLEMSQSLQPSREPKFCLCIPLAKGVCCGLMSLKTILIIIALIDITIGGAAIGIGVIAFMKYKLKLQLAAYVFICGVSLILAFAGLYAVAYKKMKIIKFYFAWKCIEVCIIPFFELIIVFVEVSDESGALSQTPTINYYIIVLTKAFLRAYFSYLIYSYYKRVDRGEQLLVEYGDRRLNKMIEEIKEEQRKQEWELELTERATSRV
ncbi:UNKNOWN [Stylonychia lemnae]|uniref:Uncharacterized protein n=1 Tax=Stylonychia lemnae TaxID=5949 RepID=A0A077ZY17_STYLE|nr:UNKNOWN [Stylonychia lemnae]|eukprot:CDW74775.1 UNKNOWN [Stylonychia lemnae]